MIFTFFFRCAGSSSGSSPPLGAGDATRLTPSKPLGAPAAAAGGAASGGGGVMPAVVRAGAATAVEAVCRLGVLDPGPLCAARGPPTPAGVPAAAAAAAAASGPRRAGMVVPAAALDPAPLPAAAWCCSAAACAAACADSCPSWGWLALRDGGWCLRDLCLGCCCCCWGCWNACWPCCSSQLFVRLECPLACVPCWDRVKEGCCCCWRGFAPIIAACRAAAFGMSSWACSCCCRCWST